MRSTLIGAISLIVLVGACQNPEANMTDGAQLNKQRPAIVLVAFGTSKPEARKVFDCIDAAASKRYPDYDIRWAFTSQRIMAKLRKQGIITKDLEQVIAELRNEGHVQVAVQSLHVVPGQEFKEIGKVDTTGLQVAVGKALLSTEEDIAAVVEALNSNIEPLAINVLAAHGNNKHPEFNKQIIAFAQHIERRRGNVLVCSIEGQPGTDKLAEAKKRAAVTGQVNFIPLMVVAGDHIMNDVMGDKADSWKSIIAAPKSTVTRSLGWNDRVLAVYFKHLDEALKELGG